MLDMAEARFSDDLIATAPDYLYDPNYGEEPSWTYEEWRENLRDHLGAIEIGV